MNHEDLQNTSGEKSIPLFSVIIWLCLCHTTLGIVKKWKLRKLDSYTSVLNRYHEIRNRLIITHSMLGLDSKLSTMCLVMDKRFLVCKCESFLITSFFYGYLLVVGCYISETSEAVWPRAKRMSRSWYWSFVTKANKYFYL